MTVELKRSEKCSRNRLSYFIGMYVSITDSIKSNYKFRVDTGATTTIIGMGLLDDEATEYVYKFGKEYTDRNITDASGRKIRVFELVIKSILIGEQIEIKNIEIFFSPDLEDRAVLGMDLLSLLEFKYIHEKNQLIGTLYLINVEKALNYFHNKYIKGEAVMPRSAMMIDDTQNDTPRVICTSKEKIGNKITRYTLHDKETGESRIVTAKELRKALKIHKIGNVTLTSDNKIRTSKSVKVINKEK